MNYGVAILVFLIIAAIGLILQGAALFGVFMTTQQLRKQVQGIREDAKQRIDQAIRSVMEILADSREPVKSAAVNLEEISRIARARALVLDETIADVTQRAHTQVVRADQVVSDVLDKVETTAGAVERNVVSPLLEVSAFFKGVRVGVEHLLGRSRTSSFREATQDDEMFI
ncbi:MAG: hypothetical protein ACRD3O_22315 [Terriglobia bacterium]